MRKRATPILIKNYYVICRPTIIKSAAVEFKSRLHFERKKLQWYRFTYFHLVNLKCILRHNYIIANVLHLGWSHSPYYFFFCLVCNRKSKICELLEQFSQTLSKCQQIQHGYKAFSSSLNIWSRTEIHQQHIHSNNLNVVHLNHSTSNTVNPRFKHSWDIPLVEFKHHSFDCDFLQPQNQSKCYWGSH